MPRAESDLVGYEIARGVAVVTLNRPAKLNAWNQHLERAYVHRLDDAAADPAVRVVVVTGAGPSFCAGADNSVLDQLTEPGAEPDRILGAARRRRVYEFEQALAKPVIAAVRGHCLGIGMAHALLCDLRFTDRTARWGLTFAGLGLVAEQGSAWLLHRLVGPSRAADLLFSGRLVDGAEAVRLGLADRLVADDEDVLTAAVDYAAEIAAKCSPASLAAIKSQLRDAAIQTFEQAVDAADGLTKQALLMPDFREGVRAARERRSPAFPGLRATDSAHENPRS